MNNLPSCGIGPVPHSLTPLRPGRPDGRHKGLDGKGGPFLCDNDFISSLVLHALIADQLHGKWRTAWQAAWIGLEVGTIQRNDALGIRLNF
jgi:hypothetical protein